MKFLMNISCIVFILHIPLLLQQVKCYSNKFARRMINFVPTDDDCPENTLCENPPGYPKEFIRQALLKNKGNEIRPAHPVPANYPSEAAYAPPPVDTPPQPDDFRTFLAPRRFGGKSNFTPKVYADVPENASTIPSTAPVSGEKAVEHYYAPQSNITHYDDNLRPLFVNRVRTKSEKPDLCPSLIKTMRPKFGTSFENEKLYIVNEEELLIQEIDIEICGATVEEAECRFIEPQENTRAVCRQKHLRKELIVLRRNGKLESVAMKIPSHCCCDIIES